MEPAQYQLQLLVSLVVILGVAFAALICDLWRGRGKQLGELTIEPQARENEHRGAHLRAAQPKEPSQQAADVDVVATSKIAEPRAPASVADSSPKTAEETASAKAAVGSKKDWGALLTRAAATANSGGARLEQTGHLEQADAGILLPAGFHDSHFLNRMAKGRVPVRGVVVSIGVNKPEETDYRGVRQFIQSLIGPRDFACQSSEREFLLVYPGDSGAAAQRRLNEMAQKLWNFQLTSSGTPSMIFSWGGVEVHGESIDEAVASASERMHEAMRGNRLRTDGISTENGSAANK